MCDRRRHKRLPIKLILEINSLFKQNNEVLEHVDEEIEVFNISKTGIGFICKHDLPLDYYFNAKIDFYEKKFFYCVIKILRKENYEGRYLFGCEFVGLAGFLSNQIYEYGKRLEALEDE